MGFLLKWFFLKIDLILYNYLITRKCLARQNTKAYWYPVCVYQSITTEFVLSLFDTIFGWSLFKVEKERKQHYTLDMEMIWSAFFETATDNPFEEIWLYFVFVRINIKLNVELSDKSMTMTNLKGWRSKVICLRYNQFSSLSPAVFLLSLFV